MFTEETLSGQKKKGRAQGSQEEEDSIRQKAIKLKLFIYNKGMHQSIIKMMTAGKQRPVITIGKLTAEIITKFEKDGGEIINDPELLEALTKSLIQELLTIAAAAEVISKDQVNSDLLFRIVGMAQQQWDKLNPDRVDKGRANRMMEMGKQDPQVSEAINGAAQSQSVRQMGNAPQQPMGNAQPVPGQQPGQTPLEAPPVIIPPTPSPGVA